MRIFTCPNCRNIIYFENVACVHCGAVLGFAPDKFAMARPEIDGYRYCENARHEACNWLVSVDSQEPLCPACLHNRTIPDLSAPDNLDAWRKLERAKRHLFYSLLRWRLPLSDLAFDFVRDTVDAEGNVTAVLTGHANGVITVNLAEADDAEREKRRHDLKEPYRTVLGHLRHEIGHYYWDQVVRGGPMLDTFRGLFGDERADYGAALEQHYKNGPAADWSTRFISAYASAHPWEDFAESWAHYTHMVDALETAHAYGIEIRPRLRKAEALTADVPFDPYQEDMLAPIQESWVPLTLAMNSINRSMGQPDLYPFVLNAPALQKLGFIHDLVRAQRN